MNLELEKLLHTAERRHEELKRLLSSEEILSDRYQLQQLSREFKQLQQIIESHALYRQYLRSAEDAREMRRDQNAEIRALAEEELQDATQGAERNLRQLQTLLGIKKNVPEPCNAFLEIRAGTGGLEATLFAADLFRMYLRHAEKKAWDIKILSSHASENGGWKEIISHVRGEDVYAQLCFESGTHRVQRIPSTESQGRIHTSACTVAVLPETAAQELEEIEKQDLRIDTFRASGAGGQHVNKTDSAVRITHLPSGVVVECSQERSQLKNRVLALRLLRARLLQRQRTKQQQEQAARRRSIVGSGDRSEKIRTYNFPQHRITDHRLKRSWHNLTEILDGKLEMITKALQHWNEMDTT